MYEVKILLEDLLFYFYLFHPLSVPTQPPTTPHVVYLSIICASLKFYRKSLFFYLFFLTYSIPYGYKSPRNLSWQKTVAFPYSINHQNDAILKASSSPSPFIWVKKTHSKTDGYIVESVRLSPGRVQQGFGRMWCRIGHRISINGEGQTMLCL